MVEAGETLNRAIEQYEMLLGNGGSGAPPQISPYQPPSVQQPGSSAAPPPAGKQLGLRVSLKIRSDTLSL